MMENVPRKSIYILQLCKYIKNPKLSADLLACV